MGGLLISARTSEELSEERQTGTPLALTQPILSLGMWLSPDSEGSMAFRGVDITTLGSTFWYFNHSAVETIP